jgi:hypothetical protein
MLEPKDSTNRIFLKIDFKFFFHIIASNEMVEPYSYDCITRQFYEILFYISSINIIETLIFNKKFPQKHFFDRFLFISSFKLYFLHKLCLRHNIKFSYSIIKIRLRNLIFLVKLFVVH